MSTPIAGIGACDQHSVLQQVMEGHHDKFVFFFRVRESESHGEAIQENLFSGLELMQGKTMGELLGAEAKATQEALASVGVSSATLMTDRLDETSIAALYMLMQLLVGAMGEVLEIDAFNQPGVELGKRLARQMLSRS